MMAKMVIIWELQPEQLEHGNYGSLLILILVTLIAISKE